MPSKRPLSLDKLGSQLLSLLSQGPLDGKTLCQQLKISQASFSKLVKHLGKGEQILQIGRARQTRYARPRKLSFSKTPLPLYKIDELGKIHHQASLVPLFDRGFQIEDKSESLRLNETLYDDIPYFLEGMRPSGFLGRLVPKQHPDLPIPNDINTWTQDHTLHYLTHFAWNASGNLILGDKAFDLHQKKIIENSPAIPLSERGKHYAQRADDVLRLGDAGSSAGGEQPKFTVELDDENSHRIVKFSPPTDTAIGQRVADLLMAENLALHLLQKNGLECASTEIIRSNKRVFLDSKRFDRTPQGGRVGLQSLQTVCAHFLGLIDGSWSDKGAELLKMGLISESDLTSIKRSDIFGQFIGNNDRHLGNYSFLCANYLPSKNAPVYDMLPMHYMPKQNNLTTHSFELPRIIGTDSNEIWLWAFELAKEYWKTISQDKTYSEDFRKIANEVCEKLKRFEVLAEKLSASK